MSDLIIMKKKLVLASASSIRATLLTNAGLEFSVKAADIDEESIQKTFVEKRNSECFTKLSEHLAEAKAKHVSSELIESYVIGSDQILVHDNTLFTKPKSTEEAYQRLKSFSGKTHQLHTSVCITYEHRTLWVYTETVDMKMRNLTDEFLKKYLEASGKQIFKSVGAYQLEGLGVNLFSEISGNYFTILGLPMLPLLDYLRKERVIE